MADRDKRNWVDWLKIGAAIGGIVSTILAGLTYFQDNPWTNGLSLSNAPAKTEQSSEGASMPRAVEPVAPPAQTSPPSPTPEGNEFTLATFETRNRVYFTSSGVSLFVPPEFKDLKITSRDGARVATPDGAAVIYLEQSPLPEAPNPAEALRQIRQERALKHEFGRIDYEALRKSYLVMTGRTSDGEEFYECTIVFEEGGVQMARFSIYYKGDAYDQAIESYMFDSFIGSIGVKRGS